MARIASNPNPQLNLRLPMSTPDLEQHPEAEDLSTPLPPDWYLQEKEEYGDTVWFCQHPETMVTTQTHESPEIASQYAHKAHQNKVDPDHTLPWDTDASDEPISRSDSPSASQPPANRPATGATPTAATVPENSVEVFDADTGDMVERSPHQQRMAMQLMRAIQMSTMVQAVALARMEEGKHYLDLGHSSFKEFAETDLPHSYRHSKRLLRIGRRFSGLLPEVDASEETTRQALEAQIEESEEVKPFAAMGVSKLREITKLEDEDVEALAEGKTLVDPDSGDEYSLEDLKEMASREVKETVEQHQREKRAYQARVQSQEETIKRLESEKESMEEEVEEAERKKEEAQELEEQYGPAAQTYEDNKEALSETRDQLMTLRERLFRADLDAESADGLKNQLLEIVRELNAIHADARARFAEALQTAEDTVEMEDDWEPSDDILAQVEETNADTNGTA